VITKFVSLNAGWYESGCWVIDRATHKNSVQGYAFQMHPLLFDCTYFAQIAQYNVSLKNQNFAQGIFYDYLSQYNPINWQ